MIRNKNLLLISDPRPPERFSYVRDRADSEETRRSKIDPKSLIISHFFLRKVIEKKKGRKENPSAKVLIAFLLVLLFTTVYENGFNFYLFM